MVKGWAAAPPATWCIMGVSDFEVVAFVEEGADGAEDGGAFDEDLADVGGVGFKGRKVAGGRGDAETFGGPSLRLG